MSPDTMLAASSPLFDLNLDDKAPVDTEGRKAKVAAWLATDEGSSNGMDPQVKPTMVARAFSMPHGTSPGAQEGLGQAARVSVNSASAWSTLTGTSAGELASMTSWGSITPADAARNPSGDVGCATSLLVQALNKAALTSAAAGAASSTDVSPENSTWNAAIPMASAKLPMQLPSLAGHAADPIQQAFAMPQTSLLSQLPLKPATAYEQDPAVALAAALGAASLDSSSNQWDGLLGNLDALPAEYLMGLDAPLLAAATTPSAVPTPQLAASSLQLPPNLLAMASLLQQQQQAQAQAQQWSAGLLRPGGLDLASLHAAALQRQQQQVQMQQAMLEHGQEMAEQKYLGALLDAATQVVQLRQQVAAQAAMLAQRNPAMPHESSASASQLMMPMPASPLPHAAVSMPGPRMTRTIAPVPKVLLEASIPVATSGSMVGRRSAPGISAGAGVVTSPNAAAMAAAQAAASSAAVPAKTKKTRTRSKPAHRLYKTEMCKSWVTTGKCQYEDKCQFAHGQHELRDPALAPAKRIPNPTATANPNPATASANSSASVSAGNNNILVAAAIAAAANAPFAEVIRATPGVDRAVSAAAAAATAAVAGTGRTSAQGGAATPASVVAAAALAK